jgi:uncharacterized protein (DUF488 family)
MPLPIYTIGYERAEPHAFLRTLVEAGVKLVLDIRAQPVSRKKGFSKNQLAALLAVQGIAYRHLRGLGTPKAGREAAKHGDLSGFVRIFAAQMAEPEAEADLSEALRLSGETPSCLLCLERDPEHCHRLIVARRMAELSGQEIEHLFVKETAM